jgi:hypothetical protein
MALYAASGLNEYVLVSIRLLLLVMTVCIVKDNLEHPCRRRKLSWIGSVPGDVTIGPTVSVKDTFEIPICRAV